MQIDQRPKPGVDEDESRPPLLSVPAAMAVLLTFTLVVLAGIYLYGRAIRPPEVAPAPTVVSAPAISTISVAPTATAASLAAPAPTVAATPAPTVAPTPVSVGEPVSVTPIAPAATGPAAPTVFPTAPPIGPTPPPELAQQVLAGYQQYWKVTADALRTDDDSRLDEVAIDPALSALRGAIEQNRLAGHAILTNVDHHAVVYFVQNDEAALIDVYHDSSIYVDPATHDPLPGEVTPATPTEAPEVKRVWRLRNVDGTWKVWASQPIS